MSLERFHQAQASRSAGYDTALAEIRAGVKRSHWIWYIFPQIEGLGRSSTARDYAMRDLGEACAYLRDPILRARYEEIAAAVSEQLVRGIRLEDLMGSRTDALKLVSKISSLSTTGPTPPSPRGSRSPTRSPTRPCSPARRSSTSPPAPSRAWPCTPATAPTPSRSPAPAPASPRSSTPATATTSS